MPIIRSVSSQAGDCVNAVQLLIRSVIENKCLINVFCHVGYVQFSCRPVIMHYPITVWSNTHTNTVSLIVDSWINRARWISGSELSENNQLRLSRVHYRNGISIRTAVYAGLINVSKRETHRQTVNPRCTCNNRPHLCYAQQCHLMYTVAWMPLSDI